MEQQAQDRIHRLGQYKPIHVTRFVIAGSIEERILKLQVTSLPGDNTHTYRQFKLGGFVASLGGVHVVCCMHADITALSIVCLVSKPFMYEPFLFEPFMFEPFTAGDALCRNC